MLGGDILALVDEFKNDILHKDIEYVYDEYLMGTHVWCFYEMFKEQSYDKYDKFRKYIARKLDVHFPDVAVIGSAKTGFSMNPTKNFKVFDSKSDIDIVVVSSSLFYSFWDEYLKEHNSITGIKNGSYRYITSCIFKKFIIFDGFDNSNDYYARWQKKTKGFEKDLQLMFKIDNDIHYRIFESWDAVKMYYCKGLLENREKLKGVS